MNGRQKGIGKIAIIAIGVVLYALATAGFYFYLKKPASNKAAKKSMTSLDSLVMQYSLNIDSLRNDTTFMKAITKDIQEYDIYEKTESYNDSYIKKMLKDSSLLVTDSIKEIIALKEIKEERLLDYIKVNKPRYELMKKNKDLQSKISKLEKELSGVEAKSSEINVDNEKKKTEIQKLTQEKNKIKEKAKLLKSKEFDNLVKKFNAMKSERLAGILLGMPDDEVAEILLKMKNRNAAKVMAKLPSAKAATLSRIIIKKREIKEK